jgi:hypothetical protein
VILRSSEEARATALDLYGTLAVLRDEAAMLRREADGLRGESVRLRRQARDARTARQEGSGG